MTIDEMIVKAHALAKTKSSYRYSPQKLEHLVNEGIFALPINEPLIVRGDQTLQYEGAYVVCYKDGAETKRTKITEEILEGLIIQYAVEASQL